MAAPTGSIDLDSGPLTLPRAIIFIGPPGSGKTACAEALAQRLGWTALDTDRVIVTETGMDIPEIFQHFGEPHFRKLETDLLDRLLGQMHGTNQVRRGLVIATGGGMPVSPGNFERLAELGEIVYLEADLDVMAERLLAEGGRPLLSDGGKKDHNNRFDRIKTKLAALIDQRACVYAQARYKVRTTALTPEQVAEAVFKLIYGTM